MCLLYVVRFVLYCFFVFGLFLVFLLHMVFIVCFFFQAEDGIRDLVRSRGLGDVYKRQVFDAIECVNESRGVFVRIGVGNVEQNWFWDRAWSVSYTHLTLPTSDLV